MPFTLIAGPCVLESRDHALMMADSLTTLCNKLKIPFIYKTSFDKANRTSLNASRGIGLEKAMAADADWSRLVKEESAQNLTDLVLRRTVLTDGEDLDFGILAKLAPLFSADREEQSRQINEVRCWYDAAKR